MIEFVTGDCLEVMARMREDRFDLVLGSPPYLFGRTYGLPKKSTWWWDYETYITKMLEITTTAARVCKGPVIWVIGCPTRKRNYHPVAEAMMARWFERGGQCQLYRPCVFHRMGIPGSGGKDWFRADTEFCLCFKRPGALPWAEPTATGKPCKYGIGGAMSYRHVDGQRTGSRCYLPPVLANPGNVFKGDLTLAEFIDILIYYEQTIQTTSDQVLQELWQANHTNRLCEWFYGACLQIKATAFLQSSMLSGDDQTGIEESLPDLRKNYVSQKMGEQEGFCEENVLQSQMPGDCDGATRGAKIRRTSPPGEKNSKTNNAARQLREMQNDEEARGSSQGRRCNKQLPEKFTGVVSTVSSDATQDEILYCHELYRTGDGLELLQQTLPEIQKIWESVYALLWSQSSSDSSDLIHVPVGGGVMGDRLCHLNEAPFSERLCETLILSLCPPNGHVLDPFSGSGTTMAVCKKIGRNGVGIDSRESQTELGRRRLGGLQLELLI